MPRYRNWMGQWVYVSGFYMCKKCWSACYQEYPKRHKHCELKKGKSDEWGNECACFVCYPDKHAPLKAAIRTD